MAVTGAERVAVAYFEAWNARDAERFRALLANSVTWEGPMWRADGIDACMAAFDEASGRVTKAEVVRVWADQDDVITWIHVHRPDAAPMPVANWMHVSNGLIDRIRATVDLLPAR